MTKKILLSPLWSVLLLSLLAYVISLSPSFLQSIQLRYFDQLIINQPKVENNKTITSFYRDLHRDLLCIIQLSFFEGIGEVPAGQETVWLMDEDSQVYIHIETQSKKMKRF